jgi:hypothetical protein
MKYEIYGIQVSSNISFDFYIGICSLIYLGVIACSGNIMYKLAVFVSYSLSFI